MKPEAIIYAVGETVFDIIFKEYQPQAAKPGGSAFNTMISLGRLGIPGQFISEVGNDKIGNHILNFLQENGVGNKYVEKFSDGKSALSLAFLNESSDAEYDFYKDYPNQRLKKEIPVFRAEDYFLFGSFYGLNPVLRPQIERLLDAANNSQTLVYYDPNFRSSHIDNLALLKDIIEKNFLASDIIRASNEDIFNIYGIDNVDDAWNKIAPYCDYFIYTSGADGVDFVTPKLKLHIEVDQIRAISTIGAGDTFNAGVLYGLYKIGVTKKSLDELKQDQWIDILKIASDFSREVCLSFENYISPDTGKIG
jgi:fructokinase